MNEDLAKHILKDAIQKDNSLRNVSSYLFWTPKFPKEVTIDGEFSIEYLKAIIWWAENKVE